MRVVFQAAACLLSLGLLTGCVDALDPESAVPKSIVAQHVRAFNAGNVEGMSKMQHPQIQWLSVKGNVVSVEVNGRAELAKNMTEYFKSPTKVTGTLRDWSINAPYVSVTETASWTAADGTQKSQSSTTVYELEDNLIRRVWYYPAVDD